MGHQFLKITALQIKEDTIFQKILSNAIYKHPLSVERFHRRYLSFTMTLRGGFSKNHRPLATHKRTRPRGEELLGLRRGSECQTSDKSTDL